MKPSLLICFILILCQCNSLKSDNQAKLIAEKKDSLTYSTNKSNTIETKKENFAINDTNPNEEGYMSPLGFSSNGKYKLFEYGTSSCGRGFLICDPENKVLKECGYYSCINDKNQLKWFGNKMYYYNDCDKRYVLPNNLPKLKESQQYVQKYYWSNGKDSITSEYEVAEVE